jgi:hypothetical protein
MRVVNGKGGGAVVGGAVRYPQGRGGGWAVHPFVVPKGGK